mgnify:CR=1 FL=1
MVATWNIAAASSYYARGVEYYLGSHEPAGHWYAPAGDFGRRDGTVVNSRDFDALYQGLDLAGKPLISNSGGRSVDRVPAYDVTLSAPRSVSLAWAFADVNLKVSIEAAQLKAARATLAMLEREAAYARRGRDGATVEKVPLTAALFQHGESRPAEHADGRIFADPNLHTHCVIANLATRADGTVGALHSKVLRDWKMAAGAMYHAALAAGLADIGFEIDRVGKNGVFEIAGVSDAAIEYFSARRNEIENELATAGTSSAEASALASAVAKATRHAKLEQASTDREAIWRDAAERNGLSVERFNALLIHDAASREPVEKLLAERLAVLPRELTEHESVVDRRELVRAVNAKLVGTGLPTHHAEIEVVRLVETGVIVEIGHDAIGQPRYSTPEMIEIERDVVALSTELASREWAAISEVDVIARTHRRGLSAEQSRAALAATGVEAIAIVEGAPGSGKTTTLAPIVDAYRDAGYHVVGTATAWRVARSLHDDLNIEARATASWIEGLNRGRRFLDSRSVLVVDEAGLLSAREMHAILTEAHRADAKVILVGDRKQLQAIGAGPGLDLVMRSVNAARVDTIVRQREEWAREAVVAFGAGDAESGIAAFSAHDLFHEADNHKAALARLVQDWRAARATQPDKSYLLVARTNAQVNDISRAIRAELKAEGHLKGSEISIDAVTPSGHSHQIQIATGDDIRFLHRNDQLGVVNGTVARVTAIREEGHFTPEAASALKIEAEVDGRRIEFAPNDICDDQGRAHLGWAYASTVYGCQGMTVDRAAVLLDANYDRHAIHVAASRAREQTSLVIDRSAIDRLLAANQPIDKAHLPVAVTDTERRALLAESLSRSTAKTTTIAVIEAVQKDAHQHDRIARDTLEPKQAEKTSVEPARRSRVRSRELDHGL